MVIGSRWVKNGGTENWPIARTLLSKLGNSYIRLMFDLKVRDATAGFRIYSSSFLSKINFNSLKSQGFSFQIEMLKKVIQLNGEIKEIPIIFRERKYGRSKITFGIILEAYIYVTKVGLKNKITKFLRLSS